MRSLDVVEFLLVFTKLFQIQDLDLDVKRNIYISVRLNRIRPLSLRMIKQSCKHNFQVNIHCSMKYSVAGFAKSCPEPNYS